MEEERFVMVRTDFQNADFQALVKKLDAELSLRDGPDHDFYHQFNGIEGLNQVVMAYDGAISVACGAIKPFGADRMEIKRMFVLPQYRGQGAAQQVIRALEVWAWESGMTRCVLETGKRQPEAIAFYTKSGYIQIENYGPYRGIENSLCFEKSVKSE